MINLSKEKPEEATAGGGSKGKAKLRMMALTVWGGDEQGDDDAQTKKEEGDDKERIIFLYKIKYQFRMLKSC